MNNKPTIRELAKKLKVSTATISRALSPKTAHLLKPATLEKVMKLVEETGFAPNQAARNLREGKRNTLGLMVPFFEGMFEADYYPQLLAGIFKAIQNSEYDFRFIPVQKELAAFEFQTIVERNQLGGLLIHDPNFILSNMKVLENVTLPVIVLNQKAPPIENVTAVYADNFNGGYQAGLYLVRLGHKKIALVEGNPNAFDNRERKKGFLKALKENQIPLKKQDQHTGDYIESGGYECGKKMFMPTDRASAVFCLNDEMALGVYRALDDFKLSCPRDISIVGYDDQRICSYLNPPLTSVRQPTRELGFEAATALINRSLEQSVSKDIKLPITLTIRESCMEAALQSKR